MSTVLFVCVHNAGRSQMAEALFNRAARVKGLHVRAISAGASPGAGLHPRVVEAMEELGISLEGHAPKLLTQAMVGDAARVITMGCGVEAESCPARLGDLEDWGLDDPAGQPIETVRTIRDLIAANVNALVAELVKAHA
ncbi:MAG: arsenate reductase ArsC [bacterium]